MIIQQTLTGVITTLGGKIYLEEKKIKLYVTNDLTPSPRTPQDTMNGKRWKNVEDLGGK